MGHWFLCFAFDLIGMITFAKRFGVLDSGEDIMDMMKQIDEVNQYSSLVGVFPSLHPIIFRLVEAFGLQGKGTSSIDTYEQGLIREHNESEINHPVSFVANFMASKKQNPGELSDNAIRWLRLNLNITEQYFLQSLQATRGRSKASGGIGRRDSRRQAVIEGLRVHPVTGFTMPRVVPPGGVTLLDHFFPEGSIVGINPWVAHMNQSVYGDDAAVFRPERWLEDPSNRPDREFYYFTFGQGSRTCVGKNIALLEISKAVPQLVRLFDFEPQGDEHWETSNSWFVKPRHFMVKIKQTEKRP